MHVILTHENADFDAIASLLGAYKLLPNALPVLPERINSNAAAFINLYKNALPFVARAQWRRRTISQVTLVDTQRMPSLRGLAQDTPATIIDHHPLGDDVRPIDTFTSDVVGATVTLIVERLAAQETPLSTLEATLLALGLYEDTGSFTYGRTTPRDLQAGVWLVSHGADLDTVRRFLDVPLTDTQYRLFDQLLAAIESRNVEGYTVVIAVATVETYVAEISRVAHRLSDTLDPAALLIAVATPNGTHLICRSTTDDIDVGEIARAFGGGGHTRASAATLSEVDVQHLKAALWEHTQRETRPAVRVSRLMSYGVHTIDAKRRVRDVVTTLRRIGHEGYPVVEKGQLVGLLTRRDADRASEHGLGDLLVRDIMQSGTTALMPDDSIYTLEQTMLQTGWGQIPVIDSNQRLLGIVTRTDLIKHWAQTHPRYTQPAPIVDEALLTTVLGSSTAHLITRLGTLAQARGIEAYMVGGGVRDLLLRRRNLDIDFVVEGDAIVFADAVHTALGGNVSSFRPFGTAKWMPDESTHERLGLQTDALPEHIDFASARNEFYEHPTALPTVYSGSIKLDLQRRDFTINTLAIQVSPHFGRILDYYGGLHDLEVRQIRVLHSLSFIDDPTRILRAVRFEQRLGFAIEPRTETLMVPALPMLGRITGGRVRNELELLMKETAPELGLLSLAARGVLAAIHPALRMDEAMAEQFRVLRDNSLDSALPLPDAYWHLLATTMTPVEAESFCERLLFPRGLHTTMVQTARLNNESKVLSAPDWRPSQIVTLLDAYAEITLRTHLLTTQNETVRDRLRTYLDAWRHMKPVITGHDLKKLGIPPGPCYKRLLERLRAALLDGQIQAGADEKEFIRRLIDEGICDDNLS